MPKIGTPELIFVLIIVLLIFGVGKMPKVARSLGKAIREFRKSRDDTPAQQSLQEMAGGQIAPRGEEVGTELEQEPASSHEDLLAQPEGRRQLDEQVALTEELGRYVVLQQQEQRVDQPRSRYIPKKVVSKLLEDMRHRCCICRVLIDPQGFDTEAQFGSLDKHHIVYFSEGGGNTYDNLLLVCANCHRQIHSHPEKYPTDELRERKLHWAGMKGVVPSELRVTDEAQKSIQVTFSVESVNLQYSISASPESTISQLALFVRDEILKPLGEYDNNDNWLRPGEVALTLRSAPDAPLDSSLSLREIQLVPDDVLVANISARVVPVITPVRWDFDRGDEVVTETDRSDSEPAPKAREWGRRHPLELELVHIPAGKFWMGTNRSDLEWAEIERHASWMEREIPRHQVYLPDYTIGRYPVTNAQYAAFVRATKHGEPYHWKNGRIPLGQEDHPVVYVSWHDAVAFCRWLSEKRGVPVRLPSEAEWEKAARGTDGRIYPWGNESPDERRCNTDMKIGGTTPVGRYSPQGDSPYDCADMAGNVWEWTRSLYKEYPYDQGDGREDLEAERQGHRAVRGGAFFYGAGLVRCAFRFWDVPDNSWFRSGFRVVASPVTSDLWLL